MRIDHIAYRVADREIAADFICTAFGYKIAEEFIIDFPDGTCARSYALIPESAPMGSKVIEIPKQASLTQIFLGQMENMEYHAPPEIFVSEGLDGSVVDKWVKARDGIGGVHHIAYEVEDVGKTMKEWRDKGWAEFTTDEPIESPDGLVQCFTKPHPITNMVYEFIKRGKDSKGFNVHNVRELMESTDE